MKFELINTIEILPSKYATSEHLSPTHNAANFNEEWNTYWKRCLADRNLQTLRPVRKGSFLVDIASINNLELIEILKCVLEDVELEDSEEQVSALCGGIVLNTNSDSRIEPTCCGDLCSTYEWEEMVQEADKNWQQLWIGHPWIFYKREGNNIHLSDYYEKNIDDIGAIERLMTVPAADLKGKIDLIKKEQREFEARISLCLDDIGIPNAKRIARLLSGNP